MKTEFNYDFGGKARHAVVDVSPLHLRDLEGLTFKIRGDTFDGGSFVYSANKNDRVLFRELYHVGGDAVLELRDPRGVTTTLFYDGETFAPYSHAKAAGNMAIPPLRGIQFWAGLVPVLVANKEELQDEFKETAYQDIERNNQRNFARHLTQERIDVINTNMRRDLYEGAQDEFAGDLVQALKRSAVPTYEDLLNMKRGHEVKLDHLFFRTQHEKREDGLAQDYFLD